MSLYTTYDFYAAPLRTLLKTSKKLVITNPYRLPPSYDRHHFFGCIDYCHLYALKLIFESSLYNDKACVVGALCNSYKHHSQGIITKPGIEVTSQMTSQKR